MLHAGLKQKIPSLKANVNKLDAAIFTIQESHAKTKGKFEIEGFEIFEAIRKSKEKGGTVIGVEKKP